MGYSAFELKSERREKGEVCAREVAGVRARDDDDEMRTVKMVFGFVWSGALF